MELVLNDIGKRYRFDWIFKGIGFRFESQQHYAVIGPNGSGKSTLLKILSGHLSPSKGSIRFLQKSKELPIDSVYKNVSFAAPYIELIEEFTLLETLQFHHHFKPFSTEFSVNGIIELLNFQKSKHKEVRFFSSGMKQRLKLILALCSQTSLVLLDEPTTNLDKQGMNWYLELIEKLSKKKTIIVASNIPEDYQFCTQQLNILNYKKK